MQSFWLDKLDWDAPLAGSLRDTWISYRNALSHIQNFRLERWLHLDLSPRRIEIHGFSDASERAYGAVVYVRVVNSEGNTRTHLLVARTKVAPLKQVSLPRLELQGAVLLSRLVCYVLDAMEWTNTPIYAWTDSTIVLAWLKSQPTRWATFVANRVSEIQRSLPTANWRHVPTTCNPADCASRGTTPEELQHKLL